MDWQPSAPRRRATLQLPCKDGTDIRALISQLPMLSGGRKWETAFGRKDKRHKAVKKIGIEVDGEEIEVDGEEPGSD